MLSGTPTADGAYPVTIKATNEGGTVEQALTVIVSSAAEFISAPTAAFTEGVQGSFAITTRGYPEPALERTGNLPPGLTFFDNGDGAATISGTPAVGSAGDYPLSVTARPGTVAGARDSFKAADVAAQAVDDPVSQDLVISIAAAAPEPTDSATAPSNGGSGNGGSGNGGSGGNGSGGGDGLAGTGGPSLLIGGAALLLLGVGGGLLLVSRRRGSHS